MRPCASPTDLAWWRSSWRSSVDARLGGAGLWGSGLQAIEFAAAGFVDPFLHTATWLERALFVVAACVLIDPRLLTDMVGGAILAAGPVL